MRIVESVRWVQTGRRGLVALAAIALMIGLPTAIRAADDAEVAVLRRQLAEKDRQIEGLKAQLAARSDDPPVPPPEPQPAAVPVPMISEAGKTDLGMSSLFDNFSLFAGLDGSKQPQDFGVNALFGGRYHFDWGIPLLRERGIGLQVGSAANVSPNAVQVFERIQGTKGRFQNFTTVGLFQRTDWGLNWGVGHDFLYEQYFDHFHLGQWRGRVGYEWDDRNEVGANLMLRSFGASGHFNKTDVTLHPINMATLFYRHTWTSGFGTTVWAGLAERHNEPNAALGDAGPVYHPFVYGAQVDAPLNDHISFFGQANFITPPSTGTVDAFLGLVYHPVGRSTRERSKAFRPVMAVANNPTFAVDLGRRR